MADKTRTMVSSPLPSKKIQVMEGESFFENVNFSKNIKSYFPGRLND